jgi:beta-phosphoglucomutase-like phosphatase (HAD superfamily)
VITDTARVHAAAWKSVFDAFLRAHSAAFGEKFRPFDVRADYLRYIEGKSRDDAIRSFLSAHRIELPPHVSAEVLREIGRREDAMFLEEIRRYGVAAHRRRLCWCRNCATGMFERQPCRQTATARKC